MDGVTDHVRLPRLQMEKCMLWEEKGIWSVQMPERAVRSALALATVPIVLAHFNGSAVTLAVNHTRRRTILSRIADFMPTVFVPVSSRRHIQLVVEITRRISTTAEPRLRK